MARGRKVARVIEIEEVTLNEAATAFFRYNEAKGLAEATQRGYIGYITRFIKSVGGELPAYQLNAKKVNNYLLEQQNKNISNSSIVTTMRHIKCFINFCVKMEYMDNFEVTIPKKEETVKEPYTIDEMAALLKKPKSENWVEWRNWAMVSYFYGTGQRLSTVLNIKVKHLDLFNRKVFLEHNKDKRQKWMPLSNAVVRMLKDYIRISALEDEDYLFPEYEGGQLKSRSCQDAIADYNKSRGVEKTSIHLFRHTFAKDYIMAGGNPAKLQKLLNHKTIEMTMNYVNLYGVDVSEDLDMFDPLDNIKRRTYTQQTRRNIYLG